MKHTPFLDRHGWLSPDKGIKIVPSPNCDDRKSTQSIHLLVIHNISLPPNVFGENYIEQLFTNSLNPEAHPYFKTIAHLKVSAHFLIRREGDIIQFVSTHQRAWHAGVSTFNGISGCNDFSIGIELEGSDFQAFTDEQYHTLSMLTTLLRNRYPIAAIRGHEHIAPVRKTDPGPFFDWSRYKQEAHLSRRDLPPF